MDITQSEFLSKLVAINNGLHTALTTTATLPPSLSGIDILYAVIETIKECQKEINSAKSEGPYMAIINKASLSTPQVNGTEISVLTQTEIITRQILIPGVASSFEAGSAPTI
jgi:hypothetical protein